MSAEERLREENESFRRQLEGLTEIRDTLRRRNMELDAEIRDREAELQALNRCVEAFRDYLENVWPSERNAQVLLEDPSRVAARHVTALVRAQEALAELDELKGSES